MNNKGSDLASELNEQKRIIVRARKEEWMKVLLGEKGRKESVPEAMLYEIDCELEEPS